MNKKKARISFEDLDPELSQINATEAKNKFGEKLMVVAQGDRLQVNRNGHPVAVIVGYGYFRKLSAGDDGMLAALEEIPATEAKNRFGNMLMSVLEGQRFAVRRNSRLAAVILRYNDYHKLWRAARDTAPDDSGDTGSAGEEASPGGE